MEEEERARDLERDVSADDLGARLRGESARLRCESPRSPPTAIEERDAPRESRAEIRSDARIVEVERIREAALIEDRRESLRRCIRLREALHDREDGPVVGMSLIDRGTRGGDPFLGGEDVGVVADRETDRLVERKRLIGTDRLGEAELDRRAARDRDPDRPDDRENGVRARTARASVLSHSPDSFGKSPVASTVSRTAEAQRARAHVDAERAQSDAVPERSRVTIVPLLRGGPYAAAARQFSSMAEASMREPRSPERAKRALPKLVTLSFVLALLSTVLASCAGSGVLRHETVSASAPAIETE